MPKIPRTVGCLALALGAAFGTAVFLGIGMGPAYYKVAIENATGRDLIVKYAFDAEPSAASPQWVGALNQLSAAWTTTTFSLFYRRGGKKQVTYNVGFFDGKPQSFHRRASA